MGQYLAHTSAAAHAEITHAAESLRWYLIQWAKEVDALAREGVYIDQGCAACAQSTLQWMQLLASNWPGAPVNPKAKPAPKLKYQSG